MKGTDDKRGTVMTNISVCGTAILLVLVCGVAATGEEIRFEPYAIDWSEAEKSVVDMSQYLDETAGRDGFVRVEGARLVKPDGSRFRIWGVNLCGPNAFPPKDSAPSIARDLARFGVNCVRFHHIDGPWSPLFDKTRDDTDRFDPDAIDRLDFFIAEFKKRGIYTNLNLNVSRQYKPGDGVRDAKLLGYAKSATYFNPRLIELQHDYARKLLTHRNPYTKTEYRHEQAVCTVEMVNENSVLEGWVNHRLVGSDKPEGKATWRPIPVSYAEELTDQFNQWLEKTLPADQLEAIRQEVGGSRVPRLAPWQFAKASKLRFGTEARFYMELERTFFEGMKRLLVDELGVKAPLVGTADHADRYCAYSHIRSNLVFDFIDGHGYWQHPRTGKDFWIANTPMVNDPLDSTVTQFARTPVLGRPYTISETNHPYPAEYTCEGIPILTAYALFHDWDGIYWFTYGKGRMEKPTGGWPGPFDFSNDPMKMTHLAACAAMFYRQDVAKAKETVVRSYDEDQMIDGLRADREQRPFFDPEFPRSTALRHATRWVIEGSSSPYPKAAPLEQIDADTGQLGWYNADKAKGLVSVNTPCTQALIGFVRDGRKATSNMVCQVDNEFCCIYLTSLDGKNIPNASRLLLTTTARSTLTDFAWNPNRKTVKSWGRPPTVIEPVAGAITLTGLKRADAMAVVALAAEGRPLDVAVNAEITSMGWRIPIGEPVTTWYLIEVHR
jgi:hypothetical protein